MHKLAVNTILTTLIKIELKYNGKYINATLYHKLFCIILRKEAGTTLYLFIEFWSFNEKYDSRNFLGFKRDS